MLIWYGGKYLAIFLSFEDVSTNISVNLILSLKVRDFCLKISHENQVYSRYGLDKDETK